ncbi:hypothetical protein PMAYCL1PPCAC_13492, partial [Pristionchus mayeri]
FRLFRRVTASILIVLLICYIIYLIFRPPPSLVHSGDRRWVAYNGFCVLPYFHAGPNVTIRLLDDALDHNDLLLQEIPRDDPKLFHDGLTLLTHSSASSLDERYLSNLITNWRGPISLAVLIEGIFNEYHVNQKISKALRTLKNANDAARLSVHIMFNKTGVKSKPCEESAYNLRQRSNRGAIVASYPINTVRNVARLFSSTRYIAFADGDYLFSSGFYHKMLSILRENSKLGSKVALLYRIFEVNDADSNRKNHNLTKTDLKGLIAKKKARVFHEKKWSEGHSMPNLPEWLKEPESAHPEIFDLEISVKNRTAWEFQFATLRDVPLFDENFPYRADNNLELRWEVCRAGYELHSVQDLFVYHTITTKRKGKDDGGRKHMIKKKNYDIFVKAKKELIQRMERLYPDTMDECPV